MKNVRILIVDDEPAIRAALKDILEFEQAIVSEAADGKEAIQKLSEESFDAMLCDIQMPKATGIDVLQAMKEMDRIVPTIMLSGHGTIETAVQAVRLGAFDFLSKPPDLTKLLVTLRNALEKKELETTTKTLRQNLKKSEPSTKMVGSSNALAKVRALMEKAAPTDARVLVTGPNGAGKELVARGIHEMSNRAKQALVEVNCAAIPSELIESELFGHEKGAFTGAVKAKAGKFEQADGGTLFLDEIGDMSLSAQAKVLRALQENVISRVGSDKDIKVNVRVIAATNKNLTSEIALGNFREDLYHRLGVILIHLPSLNERSDDIPELIQYFNSQISSTYGMTTKEFQQAAIQFLSSLDWKGNIRELKNVVERLLILVDDNEISKSAVQNLLGNTKTEVSEFGKMDYSDFKESYEKAYFEQVLKANQQDIKATAQEIGMSLTDLAKKIEEYGL